MKDRKRVIAFKEDFEAAPGITFKKGVMTHFDRETEEGYVVVADPGLETTIPKSKVRRVGYETTVGVCKEEKKGDEGLSVCAPNLGREPENEMVTPSGRIDSPRASTRAMASATGSSSRFALIVTLRIRSLRVIFEGAAPVWISVRLRSSTTSPCFERT